MANETPAGLLTVGELRQALDEADPEQIVVFALTSQEIANLEAPAPRAWQFPSPLESIELASRARSSGSHRPGHGAHRLGSARAMKGGWPDEPGSETICEWLILPLVLTAVRPRSSLRSSALSRPAACQ